MRILMIGDIVGNPGRKCIRDLLPKIKENYNIDFTIANCENLAGGKGINKKVINNIFTYGVDVATSGNHIWDKKEIFDFIDSETRILRPANYPVKTPGRGYHIFELNGNNIGIINLSGRVFMSDLDCPFQKASTIIEELRSQCKIILLDFHAEATSEKMALGRYLDGKASAIVGTHTHVQTSDERIFENGTGYITDIGMTGPYESILGVESEPVINNFLTQLPERFEVASGKVQFNGVVIEIEEADGKCKDIERIQDLHEF
ncbi:TIGR00282 family metallophosphoesterase [Natranaerobius trueperi]|uniref:Metallophosphoesterase n=1 Tax=Natranaerobius trueperi TaxID=759412 RepID=A0A226BVU7_9FIRM|nr:TIGR00282 family metallophosphoesterase [Natranaerobius trueperi]OWZ83113.1 metallophosphoesterase [Natranaerobius trueperi]